jgi:hypothetical protein
MKTEYELQWASQSIDDLDDQRRLVAPSNLLKVEYAVDPLQGIRVSLANLYTFQGTIPVIPDFCLPVLVLKFRRYEMIALGFYKETGHFERMPGVGVNVEVRLGIESSVEELKSI